MATFTSVEYSGLMAAILKSPEDDTPRLVLADYLQEQGDEARAELIRVQVELERIRHEAALLVANKQRIGSSSKGYMHLTNREFALLAANRAKWLRVECPRCQGDGADVLRRVQTRITGGRRDYAPCPDCDGTGDIGGLALVNGNGDPRREVVFRRGFVDEVRGCLLADVFKREEQPCMRCEQAHWSRGQMGNWAGCECGGRGAVLGDWQPTPWGARVFRAHPTIRAVPLADREPGTMDGNAYWFDRERAQTDGSCLPAPVFDALGGWNHLSNPARFKGYPTPDAARLALATAVADVLRAAAQVSP